MSIESLPDCIMAYGVCLPLTLTTNRRIRWVRILGFLWMLVWAVPAMAVCAAPLIATIFACIVRDVWRGELS